MKNPFFQRKESQPNRFEVPTEKNEQAALNGHRSHFTKSAIYNERA